MKKSISSPQPFSILTINRFLILLVVLLALFSGYFHARYTNEEKKYNRLLKRYQLLQEQQATPSAQQDSQN